MKQFWSSMLKSPSGEQVPLSAVAANAGTPTSKSIPVVLELARVQAAAAQ